MAIFRRRSLILVILWPNSVVLIGLTSLLIVTVLPESINEESSSVRAAGWCSGSMLGWDVRLVIEESQVPFSAVYTLELSFTRNARVTYLLNDLGHQTGARLAHTGRRDAVCNVVVYCIAYWRCSLCVLIRRANSSAEMVSKTSCRRCKTMLFHCSHCQ